MTDPTRHHRPTASALTPAPTLAGIALVLAGCLPATTRDGSAAGSGSPDGTPAASLAAAPSGPTPRPTFVTPTPTPAPTFAIYTVTRGDTLTSIADRFGTTGRSIAYWNRATYPSLDPESAAYRPNLLQVGWTLRIIPHAQFDEQTLPEPSDLQGTPPSPKPTGDDIEYEDGPSALPS
jgi:Tfp pilus assembly protein FimV